ncbi:MAG: hypothetical protein ABH836_04240 [Candidatus Omnitrophota bacterium]
MIKKTLFLYMSVLILILAIVNIVSAQGLVSIEVVLRIDGNFEEWKRIKPLAEDSIVDVDEKEAVNFSKVWAVLLGKNLYISYCCVKRLDNWGTEAFKYNVFIDVDNNTQTGYRGWDGSWALGADYLLQGGTIFKFAGHSPRSWSWIKKGLQEYGIKANWAEIKIPLSVMDIVQVAEMKILFYGDNIKQIDYVPDDYANEALTITR